MNRFYRTAGVLGGMGPEATVEFLQRLVIETQATRDQDHLPTLVLSDPRIPDRTAHILGGGESPGAYLVERARRLQQMGAGLIVIPCNTAHYYWSEVQQSVEIPVLHIVQETVNEISEAGLMTKSSQIGILATRGTITAGLYRAELDKRGASSLVPEEAAQDRVQQSIQWLKSRQNRGESVAYLQDAINQLRRRGAAAIILGCTEIGLVADELELTIPVFDSLTALARATIRESRVKTEEVQHASGGF